MGEEREANQREEELHNTKSFQLNQSESTVTSHGNMQQDHTDPSLAHV